MANSAELRRQAQALLDQAEQVDSSTQYTEADLKAMTPEQIVDANRRGQFRDLMTGDAA